MDIQSCTSSTELLEKLSQSPAEQVLQLATELLEIVIGANFTSYKNEHPLPSFLTEDFARSELSFGLNAPFVKATALPYLYVSKLAILDRPQQETSSEWLLLSFRILGIWQKILIEPSMEIKNQIEEITSKIDTSTLAWDDQTVFSLERADLHLKYFDYEKCQQLIESSLESSGLSVELAGKMGKRTRFQQKAVSQLILETVSIARPPLEEDKDVPSNCALNDDTLLEKIALLEGSDKVCKLNSTQLALLLNMCRFEVKTQYHDDVLLEKSNAFLDVIISAQRCWAVQAAALLLRSKLEKKNSRKVERACSQSEVITKLMRGIDDETPMPERKKRGNMVLSSGLEPFWQAQVIQTDILRSLGCTAEALLILESLQMWDAVIDCYKSLGQLEKAEALIRRLLIERPEDSMLYVYLGDITEEVSYYETAIKISSDKNAKARKAIGMLHLIRKQYDEAYVHLRRSLELQPIQLGVWFNAGYCAWMTKQYVEAATCYHRCVSLEPEHFEAWSNLSAAYIRQNQKERARRILQEALKYNYEHANVWENYLLLCVDTGEFTTAIQAFHRLLDLNKRQEDNEVLEILAKEVLYREEQVREGSEEEKTHIKQVKDELIKLYARVTATQTLSSLGWACYAQLKKPTDENIVEYEKYIQLLERSVLSASNKPDWSKDTNNCISTLRSAISLAKERLELAKIKGTEEAERQAKAKIRLSVKSMIATAEKHHEGEEEVIEVVNEAKEVLASVM
ncbi:unnamed protein product [Auanema sp. JU1783]|nr:unnamed protein product [Auanema sp. JU1783]